MPDTCATCRWFFRPQPASEVGHCHAAPPTAILVGMQRHPVMPDRQTPMVDSYWPPIRHSEVCGLHTPKVGPTEAIDWSRVKDLASA